jgi:hypothetical protein
VDPVKEFKEMENRKEIKLFEKVSIIVRTVDQ